MENNILSPRPEFKFYQHTAIYVGTFLGGPLVAGYLISENYKQLGQQKNAEKTWKYAIATTIVMFAIAFLIPCIEKVPVYLAPLIYTGIASDLFKHLQENQIISHKEKGGQVYSVWRAVFIGIAGLIIMLGIILLIILLFNKELFK